MRLAIEEAEISISEGQKPITIKGGMRKRTAWITNTFDHLLH